MVYCAQAHLIFANAATRNTRLTQAQNAIASKPRWGDSTAEASETPPNSLVLTSRFTARQDMEDIETALLGLAGLQAGSWVQIHECPHDQNQGHCEVERRTVV